ncbi:phytanoyl-CoA dioxygenase family protein [Aliikangiella maris]|uniref:Phytanoyl-CoA dioxygenase family protein n=2 Tax=Aliikangiella maris TaxID=3162458 RepID=A0ABV2BSN2_9GAMM
MIFSNKINRLLNTFFDDNFTFMRGILFDKTYKNNWRVGWYQDKIFAVSHKVNLPGWQSWSTKQNVLHCQLPDEVLNQIITSRLHLNEMTLQSGGLQVIPQSYLNGVLLREQIETIVSTKQVINIRANAGDLMVMRPKLLHRSNKIIR